MYSSYSIFLKDKNNEFTETSKKSGGVLRHIYLFMFLFTQMKNIPQWFQYPQYNWKNKKTVIIGGGVAGAQMAWHLCQAGWQVTLIERHPELATEASGNPAGVISPKMTAQSSLGEDFYTQCFHYTLSQLNTLKQQGGKVDWKACGSLQLTHNKREQKRWEALKSRNLNTDFIQLLNEKETSQIAGIDLSYKYAYRSIYFPDGGWINPASFVHALTQHPNCQVICESSIITIKRVKNAWQLIDNKKNKIIESDLIVITSGKDISGFPQSDFLPALAVAGQTTLATASKFSANLKTVIGHEGYLTPAINDQHVFGATFERNNNNPTIKTESDNQNNEILRQYLPEFADSLTSLSSAHVAVRMTTPDRFPYVGGLPDKAFYQENYCDLHQGKQWKNYPLARYQEGLFILGGLGSRGLTTSGFCAKALTDLIENRGGSKVQEQLLKNCHPARFLIKNLKRNLAN